jgi:3-oxoacyl-[acyl-carrier protein] reductase
LPRRASPPRSGGRPSSQNPLAGKIAVITGGNRGIGLAVAEALAKAGAHLAISGRDTKALASARARLAGYGVQVLASRCEVRDQQAVDSFFAAVRERFARVDILINNAGISHPTLEVAKLPPENWREVIDTNLNGLFYCTRAALPMMQSGGTIVTNLSVAARGTFPGGSAYSASKYGALGFTETLRLELQSRGIRVIALLPGPTNTAIWNQFWPNAPRQRMMSPASVAAVLLAALALPANTTVEEVRIAPTSGAL